MWKFLIQSRWWTILGIAALTVFFAAQLDHLYYQNKFTSWMPEDDPVIRLLLDTGEKFGSNELILVTLKARQGKTFRPDILTNLKTATDELKMQKEVFYLTSIISAPYFQKIEGGVSVSDFLEEIPQTEEELIRKLSQALDRETYVSTFVSRDGEWLGIAVYLKGDVDGAKAFGQVVKPIIEKYLADKVELHFAGEPCFTYYADYYLKKDLALLVPVVILTILFVLFLSFRDWKAVLLPSLVVWLSTLWVFGLMAVFKVPMNLVTPALPVLLVGLGSAYGLHVVSQLKWNQTEGEEKMDRLARATSRVALPVFMAALTTMVGFISFFTTKLGLISNFGLFAATGVILAMVLAFALIPSFFWLFPERETATGSARRRVPLIRPQAMAGFSKLVINRPRAIILMGLAIFVFFVAWIPRIKREVNFVSYFPPASQPRQADAVVRTHFDGAAPISIYFKTDSLKSAIALRLLRRAGNFMASLPRCGVPLSVAELIADLNEKMNDRFAIPETDGQVSNLWFLLEGRDELRQLMTDDYKEGLVLSRTSSARTEIHWQLRRSIEKFLQEEMAVPFIEVDLAAIPEDEAVKWRKKELAFLLDEVDWLLQRYASQPLLKEENAHHELAEWLESWPPYSDSSVLERWKHAMEAEVLSSSFDFEISEDKKWQLIESFLAAGRAGNRDRASWQKTLERVVPAAIYDPEVADIAVSTLMARWREAREQVMLEEALQRIKPWLPAEALENKHFQKRLSGLFYELMDNLVVLPEPLFSGLSQEASRQSKRISLIKVDQSGLPPALTQLDYYLFLSQIQSFALALGLTFLIMLFLRRTIKLGLISMAPILFTLGVVYGFFGLAGVKLDYVTMMVASVSIGVGIDYSIHFVHGVMMGLKQGQNREEAVAQAFREKGPAIAANSLAVMLGFAVLILASMSPLRTFGGIMVGSMFLAAFSALTILPALLLRAKIR